MGKISGVIQFTGKVGQVVGYGVGDRKKIRARADVVTNPRTTLQCVQRMICATASGMITAFSEIYNNSAEGVAKGAPSLAYWRGELMRALRTSNILTEPNGYIYAKRGALFPVPNQLPISRGKLRGVNIASLNGNDHLILGTGFAPDAEKSASEALAAFDYTLGDQITIAILGGGDDEVYPRVLRFAFNNDTVPAFVSTTGGFALNEAALDLSKCAGAFDKIVFTTANDGTINVLDATDLEFLFAAAIIVSRKEGQKRSSASFVVAQDIELPGFSAVSAAPSYAGAATPVEAVSDVYLDNSTQEVTVPQPEPEPAAPQITSLKVDNYTFLRGQTMTVAGGSRAFVSQISNPAEGVQYKLVAVSTGEQATAILGSYVNGSLSTSELMSSGSYTLVLQADGVTIDTYGTLVVEG